MAFLYTDEEFRAAWKRAQANGPEGAGIAVVDRRTYFDNKLTKRRLTKTSPLGTEIMWNEHMDKGTIVAWAYDMPTDRAYAVKYAVPIIPPPPPLPDTRDPALYSAYDEAAGF